MKNPTSPLIRVMALHSLLYCERLFYLEEVEGIRIADAAVYAGRRLHEELATDEGEMVSLVLESETLGLKRSRTNNSASNPPVRPPGSRSSLGFYHRPRSAAHPLALDLMELFRVPLWDMPLVASVNRQQWNADEDFTCAGIQTWLSDKGRQKAIEVYERRKGISGNIP